jgi:hypothetical protein
MKDASRSQGPDDGRFAGVARRADSLTMLRADSGQVAGTSKCGACLPVVITNIRAIRRLEAGLPASGEAGLGDHAMGALKSSAPDIEMQGKEFLASELSRLFTAIQSPSMSLGNGLDEQVGELRTVVSADYREASGFPSSMVARELAGIVETEVKPRSQIWRSLPNSKRFSRALEIFAAERVTVWGAPYLRGAGLGLWGFSFRLGGGEAAKSGIFLNTAHAAGAIATTMAHEIGHLVQSYILNQKQPGAALLDGTFAEHLDQESELFADSLVSLVAYDRSVVRNLGLRYEACLLKPNSVADAARYGYAEICPEFRVDIFSQRLSAEWRLRYLTSLVHYLKLRCALFHSAGI